MNHTKPKDALILVNLGTPSHPTLKAVRRYLKQFLADPRVIDTHPFLRYLLLYGYILPFRAPKTAHAYQAIWTEAGSPLLVLTQKLQKKLQNALATSHHVAIGMRYGEPSIQSAVLECLDKKCQTLHILPLFPHYASASSGSAMAEALRILAKQTVIPAIKIYREFYNHPLFIHALCEQIRQYQDPKSQYLLFSYHGLPWKQIHATEHQSCADHVPCPTMDFSNRHCYRAQCYATTHRVAQQLALPPHTYQTTFQSRLGRLPWIQPYTDTTLTQLIAKGYEHISIICPSFVSDCLETLEEIAIQNRARWLSLGGKTLHVIPCLNDSDHWIQSILSMLHAHPTPVVQ